MGSKRNERLRELFLQEISEALKGVNGLNSRGLLTLTGTDLTRDGKILYVYYSVLGSEEDRERKQLLLSANIRDVRSRLFKRLRLKVIPEIVFKFDETPEKASHIEDIFSQIRAEHEKTDENPGPRD